MDWLNQLGGLLSQYSGASAAQPRESAENDFDQLAGMAPQGDIADALAASFRSQETPPFPQMLGQLFGNSGGQQKADMLNTLIGTLGPGLLAGLASQMGGAGGLAGLLGGGQTRIAPEQAEQIPAETVTQLAAEAEKRDPSIVDQLGNFYAQQPQLVKTLGAAALTVALAHLGRKHKLL